MTRNYKCIGIYKSAFRTFSGTKLGNSGLIFVKKISKVLLNNTLTAVENEKLKDSRQYAVSLTTLFNN
jgi:hypothetical protein